MSRISAVLFDFGGVFYDEGFREGLLAIARELGRDPEAFLAAGVESVFATGYVEGACPERDFWEDLARRTQVAEDLYPFRSRILDSFKPRPGMAELVERTRERVKVGLLTDQTNWLYELDERDGVFERFDTVITSFEEGTTKRDHRIFRLACERLSLPPERMAFFDDNEGNVERGREFGMEARLFRSTAEAEDSLRALGLWPK